MHYTYDRKRTGGRIQAQRMALRPTQEQLSERMDCSHRFIADIERGAVGMSVETLVKACTALKTSPNRRCATTRRTNTRRRAGVAGPVAGKPHAPPAGNRH